MVIRDRRPDAVAVLADSPADKAGIKEHDIITHLDDTAIENNQDLTDLLQSHKVGDTVKVKLLRDKSEHECQVTLQERK